MAGEIRLVVEETAKTGKVAFVTIAHEQKLNTLNPDLMREFVSIMARVASDDGFQAVVLTGAGSKAFVGGADIGAMAAIDDAAAAEAFISLVHGCCHAVRSCPMPVVARINGWTLGAGLELAAACDLRLAASTARFGMPEVKVGIPSVVEAALLPGLIGWGRTRRLLMLGETISAAEAAGWGLIEKVVAPENLDAAISDWLCHLGAAGRQALRLQKALIRRWEDLPVAQAIAAGVPAFAAAWASDEPRRMMRQFVDRPRQQPGTSGWQHRTE